MIERFKIHFNVLMGEAKLSYISTKRYGVNWLVGIINLLLFLIFIQLGIYSFQTGLSQNYINGKIETLIIGFFAFSIIGMAITTISSRISEGATTGVLEHTMLSPIGSTNVLLYYAVVQFLFAIIVYFLLLPVSMLICRHFFVINIAKLIFYTISLWIASCSVGFVLGALTLIYKRTQNFINLLQFVILTLMILPSYPFNYFSLIPISPQSSALMNSITGKNDISLGFNLYIYLQSIACLYISLKIFKEAEKYVKIKGILGQY
ncbi:MAG: hypothetical protein HY746_04215 [Elusimicrobia bacterium]|nr:hypothetical protein [Elusimicrobiota bacterium]